jgi:hypothetical protein
MNGLCARLVMAMGAIPDDWRPVVDYFFTDDLDQPIVSNRTEHTHG